MTAVGEGMEAGAAGFLVALYSQSRISKQKVEWPVKHQVSLASLSNSLPSVRLHFLEVLQPSKAAPSAGVQVFKPMRNISYLDLTLQFP